MIDLIVIGGLIIVPLVMAGLCFAWTVARIKRGADRRCIFAPALISVFLLILEYFSFDLFLSLGWAGEGFLIWKIIIMVFVGASMLGLNAIFLFRYRV